MTAPPRILFVGLDAVDPTLVRHWAGAGRLPTLAHLLEVGLLGETDGPQGFFVGALWPSLYTGVNPGKHGCHNWEQLEPGTYDVTRYRAGDHVTREPFWVALCRAGRRVALLDVPLSGPTPHPNLVQVLEWGGHDPEHGFRTHPPSLREEILKRIGRHPVQGNCNAWRDAAQHARFRDDLVRGVAMRSALHDLLLGRDDWDLFFTVYGEGHCIGHQAWLLHDPQHPRHDPAVAARVGDPVRDVYEAIDESLGRLLARMSPETLTIVFASHGMGPHYDPTFMLDEILRRLEAANGLAARRWILGALASVPGSRRIPALARRRAELDRLVRERADSLTPPERRYFQLSNNQVEGGIRLNLRGREPSGQVDPGSQAEAVCARLVADLAEIVDLDTGRPIVARVLETRKLYHGENLARLPDLVVQWTKGKHVTRIGSSTIGEIAREYTGVRSGDHTPRGLLAAIGAGLSPGRIPRLVDVMDFAPTLAARLGAELADHDGRSIPELDGVSAERPARFAVRGSR